jgi:signal transduction histidine kinase
MRKGKLVFGIYALNAVIAVTVIVAMWWLPHYIGSPSYLEDRAALVQNMVDRYSIRSPAELVERMTRVAPRLKGVLALYDAHATLVRSTREPPADPPTAHELHELQTEKWSLSWRRIVVRSDDGSMVGLYLPDPVPFPLRFYLELVTGVLFVVGLASLWFSRRLARPLGTLAEAARRFGSGTTDARANLERDDELGDVGRAFDDMADRTAALISSQRQLMADVSHELRTPLARIRVALEIAGEDPVAAKDVLADVSIDLDEIDQLIADILTTARMEADTGAINRRPIQVKELADKAISRFEIKHPKRELAREIHDDDRSVDCDPVLLRRALDNLLDNAAKYSDAPVSLEIHPNGKAIAFTVVDKGIGMTAEELERAGTPFWRSDASRTRKTGGVGLGLALARRIARAHGGDVTLASTKGQGTTAKLEIPLIEGAP